MTGGTAKDQCRICGQPNPKTLETHHIVPQRYGGSDHPENLVKLCGACHNAIEAIYDDEFYRRLSTTHPQLSETTDEELGHSVPPKASPDRKFPGRPLHVKKDEVWEATLANWGVIDEEDVYEVIVSVDDEIERCKDEIEKLEDELDSEGESDGEETLMQLHRHRSEYEPEPEEKIQQLRDEIERLEQVDSEKLDKTRSDGRRVEVIHCAYCDTVFPDWERADAAKHLQLAHHIDDPYEAEPSFREQLGGDL